MVASSPLRIRVTSFLAGFGVCSAFALYQLRQDVLKSSSAVLAQVRSTSRRPGAVAVAYAHQDTLRRPTASAQRSGGSHQGTRSAHSYRASPFLRARPCFRNIARSCHPRAQAQKYTTSVEDRLTVLEAALAEVRNSQIQASVPVAAPAAQQEAPAAPQQEQQPAEAQAGTEP